MSTFKRLSNIIKTIILEIYFHAYRRIIFNYAKIRSWKKIFLRPKIKLIKVILFGIIMSNSICAETITKTVSWNQEYNSGSQGTVLILDEYIDSNLGAQGELYYLVSATMTMEQKTQGWGNHCSSVDVYFGDGNKRVIANKGRHSSSYATRTDNYNWTIPRGPENRIRVYVNGWYPGCTASSKSGEVTLTLKKIDVDFSTAVHTEISNGADDLNALENNLILWLDAKNINGSSNSGLTNGTSIYTWMDLSGNDNFTSSGGSSERPIFNASDNSIAFDGTNDYLRLGSNIISNTPYTLIVVEKRGTDGANWFLGQPKNIADNAQSLNKVLHFGYSNTNVFHFDQFGNGISGISVSNKTNEPDILIGTSDKDATNQFNLYFNGNLKKSGSDSIH